MSYFCGVTNNPKMGKTKNARKEISTKLHDAIHAVMAEIDGPAADKLKKSISNTTKKLAKKFQAGMIKGAKEAEKLEKKVVKKAKTAVAEKPAPKTPKAAPKA